MSRCPPRAPPGCRKSCGAPPLDGFSVCIAERAGHTVSDTRLVRDPVRRSGRLWGVHVPLYTAGASVYLTAFDGDTALAFIEEMGVPLWTSTAVLRTRLVTNPGYRERAPPTLRRVSDSGAPLRGGG